MPEKQPLEAKKEHQQSVICLPEIELICCCARPSIDSLAADRIQRLLEQDIDWSLVIKIAENQGVMPALYNALLIIAQKDVPEEILDQLKSFNYLNTARSMLLARELVKIMQLFQSNGIKAIPFKGPVIAALSKGDIASRQFNDLDLLVDQWDYFFSVKNLLVAKGWRKIQEFSWEMSFVDPTENVVVDIHRTITHKLIPFFLNFRQLLKRSVEVTVCGETVKTLSPTDMLIVHCVQVVKDTASNMIRLKKICDVAELIHTYEDKNWKLVFRQAVRFGCLHMLYFGIAAAHDLLGIPLPDPVLKKVRSVPEMTSLLTHMRECIFGSSDQVYSYPELLDQRNFHLAVRERRRDKVNVKYRYLFTPNIADYEFLALPRNLFFLYYIIRPGRVALRHARRLLINIE